MNKEQTQANFLYSLVGQPKKFELELRRIADQLKEVYPDITIDDLIQYHVMRSIIDDGNILGFYLPQGANYDNETLRAAQSALKDHVSWQVETIEETSLLKEPLQDLQTQVSDHEWLSNADLQASMTLWRDAYKSASQLLDMDMWANLMRPFSDAINLISPLE